MKKEKTERKFVHYNLYINPDTLCKTLYIGKSFGTTGYVLIRRVLDFTVKLFEHFYGEITEEAMTEAKIIIE